ncbi:hypothetical protein [Aeromicrobium chenweiae]|uniref:hypothetical protein n=1 Tax=Aeromicrobium chenweiae TaxID=2079793 RepID=UPI001091DD7D|nr:hypothetical protein [Aeromicrobium chenweiae]TGN32629.1 hypothetical protein E4L97_07915 [Aeromicrobium chenweiae]
MPNPLHNDARWPEFIRQWRTQVIPAGVLVVVLTAAADADTNDFWNGIINVARIVIIAVFLLLMLRVAMLHKKMKDDHKT